MSDNHIIIFDFDDTLVDTTVIFEKARRQYVQCMVELGFPEKAVLEVLDRYDIENIKKFGGFLTRCFPDAMVRTYQYFCSLTDREENERIKQSLAAIGWRVYEQEPALLKGARELLGFLQGRCRLALATKGEPAVQLLRIRRSGLLKYFTSVYVVPLKTSGIYRYILQEHGVPPRQAWVVGNSIKSDINPALAVGIAGVYIPHPCTWHYEMEPPAGEHYVVRDLAELKEFFARCLPRCRGRWSRAIKEVGNNEKGFAGN